MAAANSEGLSIDNTWNSVALEERLELLARANAEGIMAGVCFIMLMGSIAYGLDMIWILSGGAIGALIVTPLFSSYSWRREKPAIILSHLAVRSVARRYAYGVNISDIEVILIFRGRMAERYSEEMLETMAEQSGNVTDLKPTEDKPVWICLMRGGLVVLSEKRGGAKLEFATPLVAETVVRKPDESDNCPEEGIVVEGAQSAKGRRAIITSRFPAALYVFEKHCARLVHEAVELKERTENAIANMASTE